MNDIYIWGTGYFAEHVFEGEYFWILNDAEELAKYEFGNIWKFPDDVGI